MNSIAVSGVVVARSPGRWSRLRRNRPVTHRPSRCFDLHFPSVERLLLRFGPNCSVVGNPAAEIGRGYRRVVSESALAGFTG